MTLAVVDTLPPFCDSSQLWPSGPFTELWFVTVCFILLWMGIWYFEGNSISSIYHMITWGAERADALFIYPFRYCVHMKCSQRWQNNFYLVSLSFFIYQAPMSPCSFTSSWRITNKWFNNTDIKIHATAVSVVQRCIKIISAFLPALLFCWDPRGIPGLMPKTKLGSFPLLWLLNIWNCHWRIR